MDKRVLLKEQIQDLIEEFPPLSCWSLHFTCAAGLRLCCQLMTTGGMWPPHVKSWLIGKDSDAGRDWGQEEKGTTEDAMAGWHHGLYGRESEWTLGVGDWQGGLACCDSWGCKELDTTERLNWTELISWKAKGHIRVNVLFLVPLNDPYNYTIG